MMMFRRGVGRRVGSDLLWSSCTKSLSGTIRAFGSSRIFPLVSFSSRCNHNRSSLASVESHHNGGGGVFSGEDGTNPIGRMVVVAPRLRVGRLNKFCRMYSTEVPTNSDKTAGMIFCFSLERSLY